MVSDIRAQQAREHHRLSIETGEVADRHRTARNALIRVLRADDPTRWTYDALAKAVGCSPELVAAVVKGRVP